ncbi:MAG: translation initiation factor IF-5A [Methanobacteriaceae archaeon]|nr:translation initiation factor IF-5A [Methanobacteriaceae archaeon]
MATKVVEIKTLKIGKYIVLGGEASKITSLTTSSPGKHGAAKARLEAVGIFDHQKRSIVKPVNTKVDIPIIDKRVGQIISIQPDTVQLMDMESYETIDLPMPDDELKDQITEGIEVEYILAMGNMKIMRTKGSSR